MPTCGPPQLHEPVGTSRYWSFITRCPTRHGMVGLYNTLGLAAAWPAIGPQVGAHRLLALAFLLWSARPTLGWAGQRQPPAWCSTLLGKVLRIFRLL
jgi:hypothetical protein